MASHQPTKLAAKYFLRVRSCHLIKRYLVTYLVVLAVLMAEPAKTRMSYAPPQKTCRTNHKDQPHRRPAAAALPNLAPNPGIKIIARALYLKKRLLLELATRLSCPRCRSTTSPRISSARKNIRAKEQEGSAGILGAHLVAFLHAAGPGERSRPSRSTWPRRSEGEPQGGGRACTTTRISTVAAAWISMGGRNVRRRRGCGLLRVLADLRSRPRVSQAG